MATNSLPTGGENGRSRAEMPPIIILESDEEEELGHEELFKQFVSKIKPFIDEVEAKLLREKFATTRTDFACSTDFKKSLCRKASQVHKLNVYIHYNEILHQILENQDGNRTMSAGIQEKRGNFNGNLSNGEAPSKSDQNCEGSLARDFEKCKQGITKRQTIVADAATPGTSKSSQKEDSDIEIIDLDLLDFKSPNSKPIKVKKEKSSAREHKNTKRRREDSNSRSENDEAGSGMDASTRRLKRKKHIAKLEKKLSFLDKEIKRLNRAELSLEEMEHSNNSYLQKCKLEKRCNDIWNKICTLQGRPTDTGRVTETQVSCKGTEFPQIDKAVRKFLRKRTTFPDIFDIRNIVQKCKKKYNLRISPSVMEELANEIFTDIGNKMQKKRKKDFKYNFGCHLTDDFKPSLDPALNDNELQRKLDENKRKGYSALDEVFRKYVHLGRLRGIEGCNNSSSASSEIESQSNSEDEDSPRRSKKRKRDREIQEEDGEGKHEKSSKIKKHDRLISDESETQNSDLEIESSQEVSKSHSSRGENKSSSFIELDLTDEARDDSRQKRGNSNEGLGREASGIEEKELVPSHASSPRGDHDVEVNKEELPVVNEEKTLTEKKDSMPFHATVPVVKSEKKPQTAKLGKLDTKILELLKKQASKIALSTAGSKVTESNNSEASADIESAKTYSGMKPNSNGMSPKTYTEITEQDMTSTPSKSKPQTDNATTTPKTLSNGISNSSPGKYESPLELFRSKRNELKKVDGDRNGLLFSKEKILNGQRVLTPKKNLQQSLQSQSCNGHVQSPKKVEAPIIILSDDED